MQEPFEAIVHAYERESGDKVHASFGSVGQIQTKLKAGEKADLVISSLDELDLSTIARLCET